MKSIEIKGTKREVGRKTSQKIRKENQVPCNLYGGIENINFQVPELTLQKIIYTPEVFLIKLDIEGNQYNAIMQDIQFHPVTDKPLHVDFLHVTEDKKIIIEIPVKIVGDSVGVKQGGKLQLKKRKLRIKALIKDIPEFIEIDITNLAIGKSIKIEDLKLNNIELLHPQNDVVCSVKVTRAAIAEETATEETAQGATTPSTAAEANPAAPQK
jgi:large subunit ribosomal protein L25